jgi:formate C-acetyltransferase
MGSIVLIEANSRRAQIDDMCLSDEIIRQREEMADQVRALKIWSQWRNFMSAIFRAPPAWPEAVQDLLGLFGRHQAANGAAMSTAASRSWMCSLSAILRKAHWTGRCSELWDQIVQKLRIVRFLRTPEYERRSAAILIGRRNALRTDLNDNRSSPRAAIACCIR